MRKWQMFKKQCLKTKYFKFIKMQHYYCRCTICVKTSFIDLMMSLNCLMILTAIANANPFLEKFFGW